MKLSYKWFGSRVVARVVEIVVVVVGFVGCVVFIVVIVVVVGVVVVVVVVVVAAAAVAVRSSSSESSSSSSSSRSLMQAETNDKTTKARESERGIQLVTGLYASSGRCPRDQNGTGSKNKS